MLAWTQAKAENGMHHAYQSSGRLSAATWKTAVGEIEKAKQSVGGEIKATLKKSGAWRNYSSFSWRNQMKKAASARKKDGTAPAGDIRWSGVAVRRRPHRRKPSKAGIWRKENEESWNEDEILGKLEKSYMWLWEAILYKAILSILEKKKRKYLLFGWQEKREIYSVYNHYLKRRSWRSSVFLLLTLWNILKKKKKGIYSWRLWK